MRRNDNESAEVNRFMETLHKELSQVESPDTTVMVSVSIKKTIKHNLYLPSEREKTNSEMRADRAMATED